MSVKSKLGGVIFLAGVAVVGLTLTQGSIGTGNDDKDMSQIVITYETHGHKHDGPDVQPILHWQVTPRGDAGHDFIMLPGIVTKTFTARRGSHVMGWITTVQKQTSLTATQSVKIHVDGVQKCGPGFDDKGTARGGDIASCEVIV